MPNSVDTRIVEMQFDNAQFERNIKQSMKSLNELDKALQMKDAGKGFEKLEKTANNIDLSKMEKSLSFLEYRFSALGMTAAKVIDKTTDKIGNLFSKIQSMTIGQMKSGGMARALKLEHADFMLNGILKDAQKVKDIMDNAVSPAVDGTAYGLDAAANAASQFVASGIQDIDKLKTALTGISGVAAMSGSSYEEISRIFTKVAASGRMMGDEVLQLSTRGINAQAELAKYLKKTTAEVQEMQKKGQISFEMFANAMNDAFGEHAKKANDTYEGALANMKAAMSRIGAEFATPYINNMKDIFNALRETLNDIKKAMQPIFKIYSSAMTGFKEFTVALLQNENTIATYKNIIFDICQVIDILASGLHVIRDGFLQAFPEGMIGILADYTKKIGDFLYRVEFTKPTLQALSDIFGGLFSILKLVVWGFEQLTGVSTPFFKGVNSGLGIFIRLLGVLGKFTTKLVDLITSSKKASDIFKVIREGALLLIASIVKLGFVIYESVRDFSQLEIVQDIFNGLYDAAVNLASYALPMIAGAAGSITGAFSYLIELGKSGFFADIFSQVSEKLKGLHDSMAAGSDAVTAFTGIFTGGFKKLPFTITAFAKSLDKANETVNDTIKPGGLLPGLHKLHDGLNDFKKFGSDLINNAVEAAKKFGIARGIIVGAGASIIALLYEASGVARNFKRAFAGIPGVISALKNNLNANIFDVKAKAIILGMAVAIGSLTLSLVALSMVDSGKLRAAAVSLSILIGVMTAAGIALNKLGGGFKGFQSVAISFVSFAGAVGVLVLALDVLANIELDEVALLKRVVLLALIMAALGGVVIAMTRWSKPFSVLLGSGFMLSFALSIKMLVSSLGILAEMNIEKISAAMPYLLKMMGSLALIGAACTALNPFAGIGFLGIVGGITAFILALTGLAEIINPDKFYYIDTMLKRIYDAVRGWLILFAIAAVIGSIGKLILEIRQTVQVIRGGLAQVAGAGTAIANILITPLTILANAVKTFATAAVIGTLVAGFVFIAATIAKLGTEISEAEFLQGCDRAMYIALGITGFVAAFMVLQKILLGKKQFMAGLDKIAFSMAALMISLAASMNIISEIPPEGLDNAIFTVGTMMLIITAFEVVSALLAKNSKAMQMSIKSALALAVLVTALTLSVGLLSMLAETDWVPIIAAAGAVTLLMVGIAAICWAMGQVKTGPAIASAVGITLVIAAVAAALYAIQYIKFDDNYANMFVALVATVGYMVLLTALLSKIPLKEVGAAAIALGTISIVMLVFAEVLKIIETIDTDYDFANTLIALGISIGFLTGIVIGLGVMAEEAVLGLVALGGITAIFYGLAKVAELIASINSAALIENLKILGVAVTTMAVVCTVLGGLIVGTGFVGGGIMLAGAAAILVFAGAMAVVGAVGNYFADVMTNIAAALELFSPAITNLGTALASFAGQDFTGLIGNLGEFLVLMGGLTLSVADIYTVAAGVQSLGQGMQLLSDNSGMLTENLKVLDEVVPRFTEHAKSLKEAFSDLSSILQNGISALSDTQIYAVVSSLADAMKQHSEADFNSLGRVMIQHVIAGMNAEITESTTNILSDCVAGIRSGIVTAEGELTALGAQMGRALIAGFRGPDGVNSASPAKAFIDAALDCVGGLVAGAEQGEADIKDTGAGMGQNLEEGCRGPNGVDAHSNSWKFIKIAWDCIGGLIAPFTSAEGKAKIKDAGATGGSDLVDATTDKIKEKAPEFVNAIDDLHNKAQDYLNGNPLIQEITTVLNDPTGLLGGSGNTIYGNNRWFNKQVEMGNYSSIAGVGYVEKSGAIVANTISGMAPAAKGVYAALKNETSALNSNTGAVGKNSAAKAKNEEANEGKTDAIGEETEATSEEEGAVEDNTEAMYAMAEEISVVTEEYKRLYSYRGLAKKMYTAESKYISNASKIWTKSFKSIGAISKQYSKLVKQVPEYTAKSQQKLYQIFKPFEENASIKKAKGVKNNIKSITKAVMDQGKIIAKVNESTVTTYRKVGNEMHKLTFNGVKNTKKMTNILKAYQKALNNRMPENSWGMIERYQEYQEVLYDLRRFEENFGAVAYKDLTKGNQNYLKALRDKLVDVEKPMQHLSKQLGGTYELFDKNNKAMAATIDGFITLGASLYEGSEAANEYATEIAQLEFLASLPEPLIGWDVVEAAKIDYLTRMKDALIEYKQQLDETYASEIDMFTAFNKNKLEDGTNVIQTLMSNIAGYYNYGEMLNELARRLPIATESATNLVKQFAEGGIDNYGKLEAVLKLSNKELNAFIYGYGILTKTQEELSSKAMAAVANASSYSSRRQQAMAQDVNKKTTKYSAQVRKAIEADMHAVAYATIEYGEVFKIEEKKYLKTLSEIDKEQYKKVKKELARGKKYYNEQVKLLKKQEKIEKKLGDVKNYKGLNKLLLTYSKTTPGLMKKINEQIKETITGIDKVTKLNRKNDLKLIHFGKVLGAEGKNFEELMESIAEKINEWRDGIKGAINDTKNLYTEFKHVSSGINADTMISNFVSRFNALGNAFNAGIAQLPSLGYNSSVIKYIGDLFASDQDAAFDQLQALLGASAEQIKVFNQASKRLEESGTAASAAATKAALQADNEVYEREWKDAKDAYEAGMNNVAENYNALSASISEQKDAVTSQLTAIRKKLKNAKDTNEIAKLQAQEAKIEAQYSALITQEASVLANRAEDEAQLAKIKSDAYWKYKNYKDQLEAATKDADKQIEYEIEYQGAMNNVSVYEQLTDAVKEYAKTLSTDLVRGYAGVAEAEAKANQKKADAKAKYDQEIQSAVVLEERLKGINIELEQEQQQLVGLKAKLATTTKKKDRDKILSQINALNQSIKAYEKEAQTVEANAAAKRTTAEKNLDKAIKAAEEEVEAVRKVQESYDAAYASDADYQNKAQYVMDKVTRKLRESLNKVSEAVALAKKRFSQFEGQTNITAYSITMIEEGFLKLASTLDAVNDESSDFLNNMGKRLENYRKTLYDTIKGQVNLFEEFKKFSGDEATGASTYIKNMESQINGVKEWLTNLEKLADRGVAKEVIQMFAEEGQNSFEKVAAFANATEEELAALNYRYKEYLDLMEGTNNVAAAADRALATVGAAFSSAAERMQQQILSQFRESTGTEIEKAAYEGAVMVVTGVKDGLTNASPQIIAEVEGVATQISDTMAKTLNASAIEESIRTGLQTMSGAIQNTVGAIVTEFLDSVTNTSVNKFKMAVDSCRAYVEQTLPKEYTIKIRVDTSDMDAAIARMNAAINGTNFVAAQTSSAVTSSQANQAPAQQVQTQTPAANNTTVNYTQNNYSPKTLSRAEIYRQTQNQLSQINSYLATIAGSTANP